MPICKTKGCNKEFEVFMSNPKKVYCNECVIKNREDKKVRLVRFKKRYAALPERELKAIQYIKIKMDMDNPTDSQIQDISSYYLADWRTVKRNLDLSELSVNAKYFNFFKHDTE